MWTHLTLQIMKKLTAFFSAMVLAFAVNATTDHKVKFILATGPGSAADVTLTTIGSCLQDKGVDFIKEFAVGGDGLVAIKTLQGAHAKESTPVLVGHFGLNVMGRYPGVDLLEDIRPIAYLAATSYVVLTKAGEVATIEELRVKSKTKPITIGIAGGGPEFIAKQLFESVGVAYQIIPYSKGTIATTDVIGGVIDLYVAPLTGIKPMIEAGRVTVVTSTSTDHDFNNKYKHTSIKKYNPELYGYTGGVIISVRPDTTSEFNSWLTQVVLKCNADTEVSAKFKAMGNEPVFLTTNEVRHIVKKVRAKLD